MYTGFLYSSHQSNRNRTFYLQAEEACPYYFGAFYWHGVGVQYVFFLLYKSQLDR